MFISHIQRAILIRQAILPARRILSIQERILTGTALLKSGKLLFVENLQELGLWIQTITLRTSWLRAWNLQLITTTTNRWPAAYVSQCTQNHLTISPYASWKTRASIRGWKTSSPCQAVEASKSSTSGACQLHQRHRVLPGPLTWLVVVLMCARAPSFPRSQPNTTTNSHSWSPFARFTLHAQTPNRVACSNHIQTHRIFAMCMLTIYKFWVKQGFASFLLPRHSESSLLSQSCILHRAFMAPY